MPHKHKDEDAEERAIVVPQMNVISASMPAGSAFTGPIGIGSNPVCILMPAAWDSAGPALPLLTFQMSLDGGASWHQVLRPDGSEFSCVVNPGAIVLTETSIQWANMIRLCSGSSMAPVPQSAVRNFQMVLYP